MFYILAKICGRKPRVGFLLLHLHYFAIAPESGSQQKMLQKSLFHKKPQGLLLEGWLCDTAGRPVTWNTGIPYGCGFESQCSILDLTPCWWSGKAVEDDASAWVHDTHVNNLKEAFSFNLTWLWHLWSSAQPDTRSLFWVCLWSTCIFQNNLKRRPNFKEQ